MVNKKFVNKRKYLSLTEINMLLRAIMDGANAKRNYCLVLMCFIHGLRASEICQLKISDINIDGKFVSIRRLKNGFSTIHPLLDEEISALNDWLDIRRFHRNSDKEWLFLSSKGNPLSRNQFHLIISNAGRIAGLSLNIHPHMLRHACGFTLADQGMDTRLIQDYLGHRNIRHTVWYTASNPGRFHGIWDKKQATSNGETLILDMHLLSSESP